MLASSIINTVQYVYTQDYVWCIDWYNRHSTAGKQNEAKQK